MDTWWAGMNWIIETFGGAASNLDRTECSLERDDAVQAIQWGAALRLKHRVAPTTAEGQGGAFDFPRGRVAMRLGWLYQPLNTIPAVGDAFRWNMYPLPRDPEIQQVIATEVGPAFEGLRPVKEALTAAAQQIRMLMT